MDGDQDALLKEAIVLREQGCFEQATQILRECLRAKPEDATLWAQLGYTRLLAKDVDGGEQAFERCTSLAPGDHDWWGQLGRIYYNKHRDTDAVTCLRKALSLKPQDHEYWKVLGQALSRLKDWGGAADAFDRAVVLAPDDPELWKFLGEMQFILAGQDITFLGQAEASLNKALSLDPKSEVALLNLASVYEGQAKLGGNPTKWGDVARVHERIAALHPGDPAHWVQAMEAYLQAASFSKAKRALGKVITLQPANEKLRDLGRKIDAEALRQQVNLLLDAATKGLASGDIQGASEKLEQVIAKIEVPDAQSADALITLGIALTGLHEWARGRKALEKGLGERVQDPEPFYQLALAHTHAGTFEGVYAAMKAYVARGPPAAAAWGRLAKELVLGPHGNVTIRVFEEAARLNPTETLYLSFQIMAHESLGDPEEARKVYHQLLKIASPDSGAWQGFGAFCLRHSFLEDGERVLLGVITRDPTNGMIWGILGQIYERLGRWDKVEDAYRRAITSHEDPSYHEGLGRALRAQARWLEAALAFQQHATLVGNPAGSWKAAGECYLKAEMHEEAEHAFQQGLLKDDRDAEAWHMLGIVRLHRENWVGASDALQQALAKGRAGADVWVDLASAHALQGQLPRALHEFQAAVKKDPTNIKAWQGLARVLEWQGKGDTAECAEARRQASIKSMR